MVNKMIAKKQRAFTLIELLVVMVVISILAAALLVALYGAMEEARDARTHAEVAKLSTIIAPQWESYVSQNVGITYIPAPAQFNSRERSLARLMGLRDLMRMELPDRITDLIAGYQSGNPGPNGPVFVNWGAGRSTQLTSVPYLFRSYIRRINATYGAPALVYPQLTPNVNNWSLSFQNAECLYLIVATLRDEDSSGLEFFREAEIGDVDRDGMPELLDGWGHPIELLRWAPGFPSMIQSIDRTVQPDHLDLLKVDPAWALAPNANLPPTWAARAADMPPPGYLLFPLIYSAGPDGDYGLLTDLPNGGFSYTDPAQRMPVDPYAPLSQNPNVYVGAPDGTLTHEDNIHNHLIEVK